MKKTLTVLVAVLICFSMLVGCAEKPVDPSTINLDEIEDLFYKGDDITEVLRNNKSKDWWSNKNYKEFNNSEKIKLVNDLCGFDLPKNVSIDIDTNALFRDSLRAKADVNATGVADFDEYKVIVAMLRENLSWRESAENDRHKFSFYRDQVLEGSVLYVTEAFYDEFICNKNPENMFVFIRYSGPFKYGNGYKAMYGQWCQTITVIADEETGKCVFNVVGTTDLFE